MADPSTAPPLTRESVAAAHAKIKAYIHETPLITSKSLSAIASHPNPWAFLSSNPPSFESSSSSIDVPQFNLFFKCEQQQKIGAFKARGAHHALLRLIETMGLPKLRARGGVITHSSGNHAQALALAAHTLGVPAHIVMPKISTPSKIAGTRLYTEHVYFSGSTAPEREAMVEEVCARVGGSKDKGPILVPPYDHPDIILGQGTAALEMETQFRVLKKQQQHQHQQQQQETNSHASTNGDTTSDEEEPNFDAVLAPLGGGGLLAGTATHFFSTSRPKVRIYGAEPTLSGANDAQIGLSHTPPKRIPHVSSLTIADGLRTPVGVLNWSVVSDPTKVAGVYGVDEHQIKAAMRLVMERAKLWVEPSAVVPVAVVLFCPEFRDMVARAQRESDGKKVWDVGIVLSGGNTTVEAVARLFGGEEENVDGEKKKTGEREAGLIGVDGSKVVQDVAG